MKLLDALERLGNACKTTTVSADYDVNVKLHTQNDTPRVILRAVGNDSAKALKYAVSAAIVAGGAIIAGQLKKRK